MYNSPQDIAISADGKNLFVTGEGCCDLDGSWDVLTLSYRASTGSQRWAAQYDGPQELLPYGAYDAGSGVTVSPDGTRTYVTGYSGNVSSEDFITIGYNSATGEQVWLNRFTPTGQSEEFGYDIVAAPDGSAVFATGQGEGGGDDFDYLTFAYAP
jgi:DNA-binding beta-propeller fold protein YncE